MNLTVIGRKCTPRDNFKERAEKKLAKVERFFGSDIDAKITATVEKTSQTVEITIAKDGLIFRAQESAENLNEALDACVDSLVRKIRKNKTKVEKKIRSGNFDEIVPDYDVAEETDFDIVRQKTVQLKPQTVEEAILQMNMLGHKFYMFEDADTGVVSVVYCRNDGGYGVITPEAK